MADATLSTRVVWPFIDAARALQLRRDVSSPLACGDEAASRRSDQRIAHALADRLLRVTVARSGREDLGLLACEAIEPGHFDLIELALRGQRTMGEVIHALSSLASLLHDGTQYVFERGPVESQLTFDLKPELSLHPAGYDYALGVFTSVARRETRFPHMTPMRIGFPYARPSHVTRLEEFFGCDVQFGAASLTATFSTRLLDLPLIHIEKGTPELAESVFAERPFLAKVRAIVAQELPNADAKSVARRLHMSERTLRRRLADECYAYRLVLNTVRRDLAMKYVIDTNRSTQAVAELLGFSSAAAFHRAFRSWTGMTVGAHRRQA